MKKYVIATAVFLMVSLIFTACGSTGASGSDQTGAGKEDQDIFTELKSKAEELGVDTDIVQNQEADQALLEQFTGEMDLSGSWDDEISQRASMDVSKNKDGSYNLYIHWGASASETAIWEIHGTYDASAGMLSYEDGAFSIHSWDDQDNESVSGEETTRGSLMKEGEKLRWKDSRNSDDCLFVKVSG